MPLFSVVIPTYNREAYVGATLASLAAQRLGDWELIVVDDGSTDGTLAVVEGFAETQPGRVRVLRQEHGGCAAARNRGARAAAGEYLAFLDSDDLWFPWTLEVLAAQIAAHDRPTMVAMTLFPFSDETRVHGVTETPPRVESGRDFFADALRLGFALGVAHTVCRREAYLAVGGCLERNINGTDTDVLMRMGDRPGFVRVYDPPLLAYRHHPGAVTENPVKGHAGAVMLIECEQSGEYPGGPTRAAERRRQVLIRVRAVSLLCLANGRADLAWDLYRRTFAWNAVAARVRYLAGFPALWAWRSLTGKTVVKRAD
ncbi:MAG: glycosyltransferase family A protein [Planctomycetota bacterium]